MSELLKAKPLIQTKYSELKTTLEALNETLKMVVVRVGIDPASTFYVQNIVKRGKKLGVIVELIDLAEDTSQEVLERSIQDFNNDPSIHGIMIQKPLPSQINEQKINSLISPNKDVDGFNPVNLGKIILEEDGLFPCTPTACTTILDYYNIETSGKNIVVLGRSAVVGKPLANMLLSKSKTGNATVTVCHSRTQNLSEITKRADILIAAIGRANFVTSEFVNEDAIVIDVGINEIQDADGKNIYVGDVDFDSCKEIVKAITPVPGGVGSVTTYELFKNLLRAYQLSKDI